MERIDKIRREEQIRNKYVRREIKKRMIRTVLPFSFFLFTIFVSPQLLTIINILKPLRNKTTCQKQKLTINSTEYSRPSHHHTIHPRLQNLKFFFYYHLIKIIHTV